MLLYILCIDKPVFEKKTTNAFMYKGTINTNSKISIIYIETVYFC